MRQHKRVIFRMSVVGGLLLLSYATAVVVVYKLLSKPRFSSAAHEEERPSNLQVEEVNFLLIALRREERMSPDDPLPHRASSVALYRRQSRDGRDIYWERFTAPLPIRTKSTNETYDPASQDSHEHQGCIDWGYVSVPIGLFTMTKQPWRQPGSVAFELADWPKSDGTISLRRPQAVIETCFEVDEAQGTVVDVTERIVRSSWLKTGAFLHATKTQVWSYGDSDGCLNLYDDDATGSQTDWKLLLEWLNTHGLDAPGPRDLAFLLIDSSMVDTSELPDRIDLEVVRRAVQ